MVCVLLHCMYDVGVMCDVRYMCRIYQHVDAYHTAYNAHIEYNYLMVIEIRSSIHNSKNNSSKIA
jgi:hypothetical protein